MGSGDRSHVEHLAIGGQASVEIVAIPGGQPFGTIMSIFLGYVGPPPDLIRLTDAVGSAALWHRLVEIDHARAGGHAVFGIKSVGELAGRAVGEKLAGTACRVLSDHPHRRPLFLRRPRPAPSTATQHKP